MTTVEVRRYNLPPTKLIPNSPRPLLHYVGFFKPDSGPTRAYDAFTANDWQVQWIFRYGDSQRSHYHSEAHECMAVLTGHATIRFGVADTDPDLDANTHGTAFEDGGIELHAEAGDVFILPAGTAHKTFDAQPKESFELLTPGNGHSVPASDIRAVLADIELTGFTMIGAYPRDSVWDFAEGGENEGSYEKVWAIPKPDNDPVLGKSETGLCGLW